MSTAQINYSQCWEDSEILLEALKISNSDNVLSITSGGDNTLAILLHQPNKLTSIDLNPAQNYLFELKLSALKHLNYADCLNLLGITNSSSKLELFSKIKSNLSKDCRKWWSLNKEIIKNGVINSGRFEKFLNTFRRFILPFAHSTETIFQFTAMTSIQKQRNFYHNKWNTKMWRFYFHLASSRAVLKNFARQKGMFKYVKVTKVSDAYFKRIESNLLNVLVANNCYLQYCLIGNSRTCLPQYLQSKNFAGLKINRYTKLSLVTENILSYLNKAPSNTYSKYNLSDIFEALSDDEFISLWQEIVRTAKSGAKIVYWDNLLSRAVPKQFSGIVEIQEQIQRKLAGKDKVFFYGSFHVLKVTK